MARWFWINYYNFEIAALNKHRYVLRIRQIIDNISRIAAGVDATKTMWSAYAEAPTK